MFAPWSCSILGAGKVRRLWWPRSGDVPSHRLSHHGPPAIEARGSVTEWSGSRGFESSVFDPRSTRRTLPQRVAGVVGGRRHLRHAASRLPHSASPDTPSETQQWANFTPTRTA
jgi:hypothetical protein